MLKTYGENILAVRAPLSVGGAQLTLQMSWQFSTWKARHWY